MKILDFFKQQFANHRSKHQTHQRKHVKGRRFNMNTAAKATVEAAGSKLAKRFAKAKLRGPRGF
jgi:hypothetical protein